MPGRILRLTPTPHEPLPALLRQQNVEFPCGGAQTCGDCRVRLLAGDIPITDADRQLLSAAEIAKGWRLGCCAHAGNPVTVEVEQWSTPVLEDRAPVAVEARPGIGAVVDLGTTTLVAQAVDLSSGAVLRVESALNPQLRYGADVMSRIQAELAEPGALAACIRPAIGDMLTRVAAGQPLVEVLLVGNTVMHHLFCGEPVAPLAAYPFRTAALDAHCFSAAELGWQIAVQNSVCFLPNIGGFVGSDLLAGILCTGLREAASPELLVDLGTNGEIALATCGVILCASTAAGPAFEGGAISAGMRAAPGAICHVETRNGQRLCEVFPGAITRGICGSGLVDAVADALDCGEVQPSGRLAPGLGAVPLCDGISLTQGDIRQLQLASGAVAAGILMLSRRARCAPHRMHLAGAFGNYLRTASARRIGLIPPAVAHVHPAGNTALRGARLLLLQPFSRQRMLASVRNALLHVELAAEPDFQDIFAEALRFPAISASSETP